MSDITEKEFLQSYDISKFVQPSIATDIVLFTLGEVDNDRKVNVGPLQVLLIKRASHPCKDKWSLPGGFAIPQETLKQTAIRELRDETHVINAYLEEFGTFSDSHRDPRGWIVSNTWLGAINKIDCHLRADTDAWDAKWFNVSITKKDKGKIESKHQIFTTTEYTLHLDAEDNSEHLTATTFCQKVMNHGHLTMVVSSQKYSQHFVGIFRTTLHSSLSSCLRYLPSVKLKLLTKPYTDLRTVFQTSDVKSKNMSLKQTLWLTNLLTDLPSSIFEILMHFSQQKCKALDRLTICPVF